MARTLEAVHTHTNTHTILLKNKGNFTYLLLANFNRISFVKYIKKLQGEII